MFWCYRCRNPHLNLQSLAGIFPSLGHKRAFAYWIEAIARPSGILRHTHNNFHITPTLSAFLWDSHDLEGKKLLHTFDLQFLESAYSLFNYYGHALTATSMWWCSRVYVCESWFQANQRDGNTNAVLRQSIIILPKLRHTLFLHTTSVCPFS